MFYEIYGSASGSDGCVMRHVTILFYFIFLVTDKSSFERYWNGYVWSDVNQRVVKKIKLFVIRDGNNEIWWIFS